MALTNYPLWNFAVCLGEGARNANKTAKRQYQYQLAQRERNWQQTLGVTSVERVHYDQSIDAGNVGLQNFYGEMQEKYGDLIGQAMQEDEAEFKRYAKEGKGMKAAVSGQTGRSAARMQVLDFGEYMAKGSRKAYMLTKAQEKLSDAGAKMAAQTRAQQMQLFAHNNIIKTPDIAPPRPVMQNVGMAAFKDALSIASSIASIGTGFSTMNLNQAKAAGIRDGSITQIG